MFLSLRGAQTGLPCLKEGGLGGAKSFGPILNMAIETIESIVLHILTFRNIVLAVLCFRGIVAADL